MRCARARARGRPGSRRSRARAAARRPAAAASPSRTRPPRAPARPSARAGRTACRSCSGLPVSCHTDVGAERASHARPSSSRSTRRALQLLVTARALARGTSRDRDSARRRSDESSIDPPARVALLVARRVEAELARTRGRAQAGHAGAGDRASPRSGQRERRLVLDVLDANAVGAPEEDGVACSPRRRRRSTSMPSSSASRMCSSAESTSTARWLSSGRSASPGSPWWNSTYAPPTSTRGAPSLRLGRREAEVERTPRR